ncbi:MAG: ABC transporter permease [Simkaniaceae bacterium]|nr:ABC transporter permease [Simkaniaceae bacterium]
MISNARITQFSKLFKREIGRFLSLPLQAIFTPVIGSILYLLIFGLSLANAIRTVGGVPYVLFLIPGLIAMSVIKNAFDNASSSVMAAKYINELQDLRTSPLPNFTITTAIGLASLVRGLLVGLLTYLAGALFLMLGRENHWLAVHRPLAVFYFAALSGLSFGFLGIATGMWSKRFEHTGAVGSMVLTPLIYLGGVFFNLDTIAPFWQKVSLFNPLFYIINGIRFGFIGRTDVDPALSGGITALFTLLTGGCAYASLTKGPHYLRQ